MSDREYTAAQLAALAEFERACQQFRRLASTDEERCRRFMLRVEEQLLRLWPKESDEDSLWGRAGCLADDTQIEQDFKQMRTLLRMHLQVRDDDPPPTKVLMMIAAYLFCHYLSHPDHPNQRSKNSRRRGTEVELLGIQDLALAIFVEAHHWNSARVLSELARIRDVEGWIPKDRRFDGDSHPMRYILSRTWLSEEIFLRWVQQHDGLI